MYRCLMGAELSITHDSLELATFWESIGQLDDWHLYRQSEPIESRCSPQIHDNDTNPPITRRQIHRVRRQGPYLLHFIPVLLEPKLFLNCQESFQSDTDRLD